LQVGLSFAGQPQPKGWRYLSNYKNIQINNYMKKVFVLEGIVGITQRYEIPANTIQSIGRSRDNDLILIKKSVSRKHMTLEHDSNGLLFGWDNNSTHGTDYSRQGTKYPLTEREQLYEGDILLINPEYAFKIKKIDLEAEETETENNAKQETDNKIEIE
jgi:pSer/pThr/pTyr-binding forkhead associated (FHA) protein